MFSIAHIVIIFVVALVVFGPEKLPDLARNLGKFMGEFRRATGDLRSTFEGHMRDLEREADLRKAREGQAATPPAAQEADAQIGTENSIGGGRLMTPLPVAAESSAATPASPQQLEFETEQIHAGERPDSEAEKANDVRSRPA